MFRKIRSLLTTTRRAQLFPQGRRLRYETMEGRLVLSASGFAGNECAPELDDVALDAIVPNQTQSLPAETQIAFQISPSSVVSDAGVGASAVEDITLILDPDLGTRITGASPDGATLSFNDQGTTDTADDTYDFSWTPTASQTGMFRLFIIATDDGGSEGVPLSDAYSFDLNIDVSSQPVVDLNGLDDEGIDFGPVDFTEADNSTPVSIVDTDLVVSDSSGMLSSATIAIDSTQADGLETLAVTPSAGLVVDDSTPGVLIISVDGGGLADSSLFQETLRTLTYNNTSDDPLETRTINVVVNDGAEDSQTATTTVNITRSNDSPDLMEITNLPNAVVGQEYVLDLVASDPDTGDLLVFRITNGPGGAVISPNGLSDDSSDNTIQVSPDGDGLYRAQIRWTPTAEQAASSPGVFVVTATDNGGGSDVEVYSIGIDTVNQAPVANDDPFSVGEDDGDTVVGDVLANDTDVDNDTFVVNSVTAGGSSITVGQAITLPSGAVLQVAANGQVNYNPSGQFEGLGANETATETFEYTVIDSESNESTAATVTITINGANDAPTATTTVPVFRISEAAGETVLDLATLLTAVSDLDSNDTLSVVEAPTDPAQGGTFALNGDLTFNPDGDYTVVGGAEPTIDFMVTIEDSAGEQVTVPAQLIIEDNVPPTAVNDPNFIVDEDLLLTQTSRTLGVLANDTDDSGVAGLSVAEVNGDAANIANTIPLTDTGGRMGELTVSSNGTFSFDPRGNFNTLAAGTTSEVTFTYRATDGAELSNEATVTITINGVNEDPVANDVTGAAVENGTDVDINFDGSDVDEGETATLVYTITSQPSEGTVTNNDDGSFNFDPADDFQDLAEGVTRDVTFNYTATDARSAVSDEAMATITVTGVNSAPAIDISDATGIPSVLPSGAFDSAGRVIVNLDLSSSDPDVSGLNDVDIQSFTSDPEGDAVTLSEDLTTGTAFGANAPTLSGSGVLSWTPTTDDIGTGYIVRILGDDVPSSGTAEALSPIDIELNVIDSLRVQSVSESIDVSLADSEITILFQRALGASALTNTNYQLEAVDGSFAGNTLTALTVTADGTNGVTLSFSDTGIGEFADALAGGTKVKLLLDSAITDVDGNSVAQDEEFEIDLLNGAS